MTPQLYDPVLGQERQFAPDCPHADPSGEWYRRLALLTLLDLHSEYWVWQEFTGLVRRGRYVGLCGPVTSEVIHPDSRNLPQENLQVGWISEQLTGELHKIRERHPETLRCELIWSNPMYGYDLISSISGSPLETRITAAQAPLQERAAIWGTVLLGVAAGWILNLIASGGQLSVRLVLTQLLALLLWAGLIGLRRHARSVQRSEALLGGSYSAALSRWDRRIARLAMVLVFPWDAEGWALWVGAAVWVGLSALMHRQFSERLPEWTDPIQSWGARRTQPRPDQWRHGFRSRRQSI